MNHTIGEKKGEKETSCEKKQMSYLREKDIKIFIMNMFMEQKESMHRK